MKDSISHPVFRLVLLILLAGLAIFIVYRLLNVTGLLETFTDSDQLRDWVAQSGHWGPVILMALMAAAIVINPLPSAPIAVAAGAAFGHAWGTLYVVAGATLGAVIAFSIARRLGYEQMRRLFGERLQLGWMGSQHVLMGMVFVSRLIPFISFDLVSYGAGLTGIKTWRFVLATVVGLIPASFLLAHFGGELTSTNLNRTIQALLLLGVFVMAPSILVIGVRLLRNRRCLANKTRVSDR